MIKTKFIFAVSFLALFVATDYAFGAIASSGYVDQQVGTRLSSITGSTTGEGNVVTEVTADGSTITATKGINAEVTSNKATAESVVADDKGSTEKYPSVAAAEKIAEVAAQAVSENSLQKDGVLTEGNLLKSDASGKAVDSGVASDKVLTNTATGLGAVGIESTSSSVANYGVAIGNKAQVTSGADDSISIGHSSAAAGAGSVALGGDSLASGPTSMAIGSGAYAAGAKSVALGTSSSAAATGAVALGGFSTKVTGDEGIAIGSYAESGALGAIQLGRGTNSEANTFSVGLSFDNNYKLLGSDGKIPAERMPDTILTNTATGTGSFSTGGATPVTYTRALALGYDATASDHNGTAIGANAASSGNGAIALGDTASSEGEGSVAIGGPAIASGNYSVAMGIEAEASAGYAIAFGPGASANNSYSIQLGQGTNSEANTFSVGLSSTNNYKLLGSDGKIPAERLPFEGDVLTNTATGENSFSTGGATPVTGMGAVALGAQAQSNGSLSTSIGYNSQTKDFSGSVALGGAASVTGIYGTALGASSSAGISSVAVGRGAKSNGDNSIAVGSFATAEADNAIQLGNGINSEASTFNVALGANNYRLLNTGGKIPAERLPAAMIPVGSSTSPSSYATFWIE